jgi:DNA invertase Pin-like site-specific DNA recombinase
MSNRNSTGNPVPVIDYYRMSTGHQEASIPEQREWAEGARRREGLSLVRAFEDEAVPGSEIESRPGLMELLAFCEERASSGDPVEAIVCWDGDRFSRADSIYTAAIIARLRDAGVSRMLTPEGWTDFENELDRLLYNLKQDLARSGYSKAVSKNVSRSRLQWALAGKWAGLPPYGYRKGADKHLVVYEPEAEVVRWLFERYACTAASLGDLARELTARGVKPPRGGEWRRDTIRVMLTNRAYLGDLVWNAKRRGKYSRIAKGEVTPTGKVRKIKGGKNPTTGKAYRTRPAVKNDPADVLVVEGAHPALTDRQTFEAVAAKLPLARWKRTTPQAGGGEWALSGLLHCARCGGRMQGNRRVKPRLTLKYVCHGNARSGREALLGEEDRQGERDRRRLRDRIQELEGQVARGTRNLALAETPEEYRRVGAVDVEGAQELVQRRHRLARRERYSFGRLHTSLYARSRQVTKPY